MSAHGRRRQNPEPAGPAQLAWALLVVVAAGNWILTPRNVTL